MSKEIISMEKFQKKVYIETLDCQMNKSDSERILGMLSHFGYEKGEEDEADFLIINTCSIRKLSEDKAYSKLGVWGKMKKDRPQIKIAICGCVAQQEKDGLLKQFPYLDLVFGTHNIYELPDLLQELQKENKDGSRKRICAIRDKAVPEKEFNIIRSKGINAWLPIMEGCNNFCTYCIVPYTRGRERSRDIKTILEEARKIIAEGFKEITLLGQNVDSYGKDLPADENGVKPTFANLLAELDKLEGKFRIRFTTSYPTDITDDVIETVQNANKICECFHIPMQSGNDRVLKAMNRRYNRQQYSEIVNKIRNKIKDVTITSDFIAGFPSETEEEFSDTISAIKELGLDYSNTAAYSPRPNTPAGKMVDKFISNDVKKERLARLNDTVKMASKQSNTKAIGKTFEILVEKIHENDYKNGNVRIAEGRSRNNKVVHCKSNTAQVGDFINVKIKEALIWCLKGDEVVTNPCIKDNKNTITAGKATQ